MVRPEDYYNHISGLRREPSVLTDVPRYPNAQMAFNKRQVVYEDDEIEAVRYNEGSRHGIHHHHHNNNPEILREKVEVIRYEEEPSQVGYREEVIYEDVRRNRPGGLELHKWKTYRP
ncbi:uncharacterized protein [Cicer arietinum]|uniref:Uncharacterized protein LOC101509740 n=1 Tax=Cicer arietinum TaxID=3827 RepID=A0A1S2YBH6_CICAR|nr:uncharacterized protein LOC101509740 [Cicer arietinum]